MMSQGFEQGGLHITIGSTPQVVETGQSSKIVFENDLRMVKAALLYANHATLCSVTSSALLELVAMKDVPREKRVDYIKQMVSWMGDDESARLLKGMMTLFEQSKDPMWVGFLEEALADGWDTVRQHVNNFLRDGGGEGILRAIESGLLEVHHFDAALRRAVQESERRNFIIEYVAVVGASVANAYTYPLFDEDTSEIISAGIRAGLFSAPDSTVARGKEVRLAADLLARLPLFPQATVKETLDIRRELEPHLKRFQSAIIKFSEAIKTASWDEGFAHDADRVFRRDVEPAVQNIEEEVKANNFIKKLLRKFADKPMVVPVGSALALAMSNLPLPGIALLAAGGVVGGGSALYDAHEEWSKKMREVQQNSLFFYYRTKNLLTDRKYDYVSDKE
jgi:hypothetical protein